jgi:hypothetical protein
MVGSTWVTASTVLTAVSVSGLVVIIDLLRTPRRLMHSTETQQKILEVKSALDQMR